MKPLSIAVIDTETATLHGHVFDIGIVITNKRGDIIEQYTALVSEVLHNPTLMMGAFYAKKIFSDYIPMIAENRINIKPWALIVKEVKALFIKHKVCTVAAYNLAFDARVLGFMHRCYKTEKLMPYPVKMLDIWRFACESLLNTNLYKDLAFQQNWISEAGNIKSGAEVAYRYITGDWYFVEDHTALSDSIIETEILRRCFAAKKSIPYNKVSDKYEGAPWRLIQN